MKHKLEISRIKIFILKDNINNNKITPYRYNNKKYNHSKSNKIIIICIHK
jgi:hypothetical protein